MNVLSVQDNAGKPRSATDLSLLHNGKVDSGSDSRRTITMGVCPGFMHQADPEAIDQVVSFCPVPIMGVPEFGSSALVVVAATLVLVVFIKRLSVGRLAGVAIGS